MASRRPRLRVSGASARRFDQGQPCTGVSCALWASGSASGSAAGAGAVPLTSGCLTTLTGQSGAVRGGSLDDRRRGSGKPPWLQWCAASEHPVPIRDRRADRLRRWLGLAQADQNSPAELAARSGSGAGRPQAITPGEHHEGSAASAKGPASLGAAAARLGADQGTRSVALVW